ncbi:hypothetical protein [Hymenobacter glaciei]
MNPTDFSVLLLAWDDADPGVAVLGGSALPPTLPLVYRLATQQPVLALYPHLPAAATQIEDTPQSPLASTATSAASTWPEPGIVPSPLEAETNGPGVRLLLVTAPTGPTPPTPAGSSRLVGLDELLPAVQGALPTAHSLSLASAVAQGAGGPLAAANSASAARSQWPAHSGPLRAAGWQAPAAPYAGATDESPKATQEPPQRAARESFPAPPPRPVPTTPFPAEPQVVREASHAPETDTAVATSPLQAASVSTVPSPADVTVPALFDAPVEEMGAAEASDLSAPEDDLVPDIAPPAQTATAPATEAEASAPAPAATWAVRQPTLEGLNFRMIQYARQAAQLVDSRQDFGVIYAPSWPAWLAALEIRLRSGQPLVLYAAALASDTAPAAERGWLLGLERMALRRAHLVLVPDAEVLHQIRTRHPDALGEIRIVPATDEAALQLVLAEVALG